MKLTHKTALEKSIKMFKWLLECPMMWKVDYFIAHPKLKASVINCYLCELYIAKVNCEGCIKWYPRKYERHEFAECIDPQSPFYLWQHSWGFLQRKKYLVKIVKLLENNLHNSPD